MKTWIAIMTLAPTSVFFAWDNTLYAAGMLTGGVLVMLNLLGTERAVSSLFTGGGLGKAASGFIYVGKLGVTVAIITGVLVLKIASPLALVLGLLTLPAALVFDFLIFTGEQETEEEP